MNRKMLGMSLLVGVLAWVAYVFWPPGSTGNGAEPAQGAGDQPSKSDRGKIIPAGSPAVSSLPSSATNTPGVTANAADNATLAAIFTRMEETLRELAMLFGFVYAPAAQNYAPPDDLTYQVYQPRIDSLQQRFDALRQQANGISTRQTQRFLWEQLNIHGLGSGVNYLLFDAIGIPEDPALMDEMLTVVANTSYVLDDRLALFQGVFLTHGRYYDYSGATGQQGAKPAVTPSDLRLKQFLEEQFQLETNPQLLSSYLELYYSMVGEGSQVSRQKFQQQLELLRMQLSADQYFDFRLRGLTMQDADADYASLLQEIDSTRMTLAERGNLMMNLGSQLVGFLMPLVYNTEAQVELPARTRQVFQHYLETHLPQPSLQNDMMLYQYATQMEGIYLLRYGKNAPDRLYDYLLNGASLETQVALLGSALFQEEKYRKRFQQAQSLKQGIEQALAQPDLSLIARSLLESTRLRLNEQPAPPPAPEMGIDENGNPVTSYYTGESNTPDEAGVNPERAPGIAVPVPPPRGY